MRSIDFENVVTCLIKVAKRRIAPCLVVVELALEIIPCVDARLRRALCLSEHGILLLQRIPWEVFL